ncbi:hypothetical protein ABZY57_26350 [Streptomyces sp. NPDC006450]|uniref:hypothetical protein n=1 Tax=Streptomyces sp. NPDC006450 TaxID=3155458 RepID=UPI0033A0ABF0
MITEPEFDGGSSGPPGSDDLAGPEGHEGHGGSPRPGRRPWRWALGGALIASVLWAGAWWTVTPQDGRPPLRYALPQSLCDEAKMPALARQGEVLQWQRTPKLFEHPGVDQAYCQLSTTMQPSDGPGQRLSYEVQAAMTLHKRTDPAPEFGADPAPVGWLGASRAEPRSVPGLGERALIWEVEYGQSWRLAVLDGGTVFTVDVTVWAFGPDEVDGDGNPVSGSGVKDPPQPDSDAVQAAMIDDMHGLMKALRR